MSPNDQPDSLNPDLSRSASRSSKDSPPTGRPGRPRRGWKKDTRPGAKPALCHPDREYYAKGFCKACYNHQNLKGKAAVAAPPVVVIPADLAVNAAMDARVRPEQVYVLTPEPKPAIDVMKPQVAAHFARATVMNNMDMEAAVKVLAPELTPGQAADMAETLEGSSVVKVAIERELAKRGLDEQSKTAFVEKMWQWLEGTEGEKRAMTAARILGKGFISERIDVNKPADLPIRDLSSGIAVMMGAVAKRAEVAAVEVEEDDEGLMN